MALEIFTNQPSTIVTAGGTDAPAPGTQQTWTVLSSSTFPAASSSASPPTQFHIVDTAISYVSEIIAVTNVSGTTWTVTRGAEGTTPIVHVTGFTVQQVMTAGFLNSIVNPMTMLGDTLYGGASGVLTRLAGNTTATRNFLRQQGTGSVSAAPAWDTLQASDLPGATTSTQGAVQLAGDLAGTSSSPQVKKIQGTSIAAPTNVATQYLNGTGNWTTPAGGGGGSSVLDWVSVVAEGADPTGSADSTAAFNAAVAALPSGGGIIYVPSGTYKISGTITFHQNQGMVGDGHSVSILNYTGNSTCLQVSLTGTFTGNAEGGFFQGFQVSAYGGGTAAVGMQVSDLQGVRVDDVSFYGCGKAGMFFTVLAAGWAEEGHFTKVACIQCGQTNSNTTAGVIFSGTSFDYGFYDFTMVTNPAAHCIVLQTSTNMNGCFVGLRGNVYASATNNAAVIAIDPGNTSGTSYLQNTLFNVSVETAGSGNGHFLLLMGSTNATSQFSGSGTLSLFPATVNAQGISNPNNLPVGFSGIIKDGASTPIMAAGDGLAVLGGSTKIVIGTTTSTLAGVGGVIYNEFGDTWITRLASGANTITSFDAFTKWGRDVDLFIGQPTSGAAGTLTWPSLVAWPGGTTPSLSSGTGVYDWFRIKWLGSAVGVATGVQLGKGYTL